MDSQKAEYYRCICEKISEYSRGREIVFYGNMSDFNEVLKESRNLKPAFHVTALKEKVNDETRLFDDINKKSDKYYVVVLLEPSPKLRKKLRLYGYRDFKDCMFVQRKDVVLNSKVKNYEDGYGNKVTNNCGFIIEISKYAFNSEVTIGEGTICKPGAKIHLWKGTNKVTIGDNCRLRRGLLFCTMDCEISLGSDTIIMDGYEIICSKGTRVFIGDHCMFSDYIKIRSGDGHAIFDMKSGRRINDYSPEDPKSIVNIGRHVWLGWGASVLGGSEIGDCCIIGAFGVFKGSMPGHCIAAGNPAKIIKRDINWSSSNFAYSLDQCEPYLNEID